MYLVLVNCFGTWMNILKGCISIGWIFSKENINIEHGKPFYRVQKRKSSIREIKTGC